MRRDTRVGRTPGLRRRKSSTSKRNTRKAPVTETAALKAELRVARDRQAASAEVLRAIATTSGDADNALRRIAEITARLFGASSATIHLAGDGDQWSQSIRWGTTSARLGRELSAAQFGPGGPNLPGTVLRTNRQIHVPDLDELDPAFARWPTFPIARASGTRSMAATPLRREGKAIGVLNVHRARLAPFSDDELALLQSFADQAAIAIENARLFEEVRVRTSELSESLLQQTATADVLKVISRSAFDLKAVLDTLVKSAASLCTADTAIIYLRDGELFHAGATFGSDPQFLHALKSTPRKAGRDSVASRVILSGEVQQVSDVREDKEYHFPVASTFAPAQRAVIGVPLLREGGVEGVLALIRNVPGLFVPREITLLQTFADQAVIAIQNVKLFDEVQARTRELSESLQQQTATADVLKVISRSTFDLEVVLHTLVESAAKLTDADKATITRQRDGVFYRAESFGFSREFMDYVRTVPVAPERSSASGRALLEGTVVHIPDVKADQEYTFKEAQRLGDYRAILAVPMLREGSPVGVIVLTRTEPRAFTDKQIELVTTFADQAAIAIENVRLFDQVQARTRELSQSLDDLRTAQDRLIQTEKLASLGQLTAGVAHEIKNPLNFVNNFAALSVELADELRGALKPAVLDQTIRAEVDEITGLLKDNLGKVVQHGRRADSIVKNMLLHSREGSGERRPADINALVGESLNLAYHGARAEKPGFTITLKHDLDPNAGALDLYPQEITRALLNLISNGFYAATRRKLEADDSTFEPVLGATTRDLGETVEIRIRDNGTGIPPEVKEKMFNPFFTTKPSGEGTGLGLSITHDIIVKQHGGRIDVETEPGAFTEFIITLRRGNVTAIGEKPE